MELKAKIVIFCKQNINLVVGSFAQVRFSKYSVLVFFTVFFFFKSIFFQAKSSRAAEYTDCINAQRKIPLTSVLCMTLNNLMMKMH